MAAADVLERPAAPSALIRGATGEWEIIVGLEVHAQVTSNAKLFSGASTAFGAAPNTQVSPVDAGMPGMLPVVNRRCVEQAVRTGLGLRAEINRTSVFERKNYFYPDLPNGYQISQYAQPIVGRGVLTIDLPDGASKEIGITRLHLEMDAGKSLHDQKHDATLIDLNRSGVALMEIVSEPDIRSGEEAVLYLRKLRSILRYLGSCDGNMEQGSLRCDANVSVRRPGDRVGGAAPGRADRGRRRGRAGDAPVRLDPRRDEVDAQQGRSARLPVLPRSGPAAAGPRQRLDRGARSRAAGIA